MNQSKIILDLCGGTGSWSKPYKEAGYDVRVITLPEYDVTKVEFGNYAMEFIRQDVKDSLCVLYEDVYGILAAPPCTMFSLARTTAKTPRDFKQGLEAVEACERIIRKCRIDGGLKFWAMENPRGYLRQFLGKPAFQFKHWEFGDTSIKPTDIWGYFNEPKKIVNVQPSGLTKTFPNGRINSVNWSNTAKQRAITPKGFAEAFFKANR